MTGSVTIISDPAEQARHLRKRNDEMCRAWEEGRRTPRLVRYTALVAIHHAGEQQFWEKHIVLGDDRYAVALACAEQGWSDALIYDQYTELMTHWPVSDVLASAPVPLIEQPDFFGAAA